MVSIVATFGLVVVMLVVNVGIAFAGSNSTNAKLCQKRGWQTLVRADGTNFTNEALCIRLGAKGGTLYRPVTATVTAANKVYDGANAATITGCSLTGVTSPTSSPARPQARPSLHRPRNRYFCDSYRDHPGRERGQIPAHIDDCYDDGQYHPTSRSTYLLQERVRRFQRDRGTNTALNGDFYYSFGGDLYDRGGCSRHFGECAKPWRSRCNLS